MVGKILMIGISTAQNLVNVIPALCLGASEFCFVETDKAIKDNWSKGATVVLKNRKIKITKSIEISSAKNNLVIAIKKQIIEETKHYDNIIFNFGGGQKAQSTAIWEAFRECGNSVAKACYIDQTSKKITVFEKINGEIKQTNQDIKVDLTATEIFTIHGFNVTSEGEQFYNTIKLVPQVSPIKNNLLNYQEFRAFIAACYNNSDTEYTLNNTFSLEEIKGKFNNTHKQLLDKYLRLAISSFKEGKHENYTVNKKQYDDQYLACLFKYIKTEILKPDFGLGIDFTFNDENLIKQVSNNQHANTQNLTKLLGNKNIGTYFEGLLIATILGLLQSKDHNFTYAYSNFKIAKGNDAAEYDVVLVTNNGTLIVLDAKTGDFDKKDEDARKFNLLQSGGIYSSFIPVYLFYPQDAKEIFVNKSIRAKILEANLYNKRFYTYNNQLEITELEIDNTTCKLNHINNLFT
jgi:hypothetical protein